MTSTKDIDSVATTIETAADLVRVNGLHKGGYWPGAGVDGSPVSPVNYQPGWPVCAYGALAVADGVTLPFDVDVHASLANMVCERVIGFGLHYWNDDPTTTADNVVETFLQIAKALRNGEVALGDW